MITHPVPQAEVLRTAGGVQSVQADSSVFGGGIARGLGAVSNVLDNSVALMGRMKQRRDYDAADAAYTQFAGDMDGALSGRLDGNGNMTPGLKERKLGDAQGLAADYAKTEKEWMNNPDGAFSRLTESQRQLFNRKAAALQSRMQSHAVSYEHTETEKQRTLNRDIKAGVTAQAAANTFGTPQFLDAATEAAEAAADRETGWQMIVDPNSGERVFKNAEAKQLWSLTHEQALEKLRLGERKYYLDKARETDIEDVQGIEGYIAAATQDLDQFTPESQTAVRNAVKDLTASIKRQREARAADGRQAEAKASRIERGRIDDLRRSQILGGFTDTEDYVRELSDSGESAYANQMLLELESVKAARVKEASDALKAAKAADDKARSEAEKAQAEFAKVEQEREQRLILGNFDLGAYTDSSTGQTVTMTPEERIDGALYSWQMGKITEDQFTDIKANALAAKDQRIESFRSLAINQYIPSQVLAIEKDDQGRFKVSEKFDEKKGKRVYSPDSASGLKREWTQDGRWGFDTHKEDVLLSDVAQALNVVALRMQVDKSMTPEAGAELFGKLTQGGMAEYAKKSFAEMINEESSLLQSLKAQRMRERVQNLDKIRGSAQ